MNKVFSNDFQLKGWMAIPLKEGLVLKYEGQGQLKLVEIASSNDVYTLCLDDEINPAFSERDAWLIAHVIHSMLESSGKDNWGELSLLLPVSFEGFSIENLRALAALVYCFHTQHSILGDDEEQVHRCHVRFDSACWMISINNELELDFIQKI